LRTMRNARLILRHLRLLVVSLLLVVAVEPAASASERPRGAEVAAVVVQAAVRAPTSVTVQRRAGATAPSRPLEALSSDDHQAIPVVPDAPESTGRRLYLVHCALLR